MKMKLINFSLGAAYFPAIDSTVKTMFIIAGQNKFFYK